MNKNTLVVKNANLHIFVEILKLPLETRKMIAQHFYKSINIFKSAITQKDHLLWNKKQMSETRKPRNINGLKKAETVEMVCVPNQGYTDYLYFCVSLCLMARDNNTNPVLKFLQ